MSMDWGIRKTVLALSIGPAAVIAVILTIFFTVMGIQNLENALEQRGRSLALRLAASSEFGLVAGNAAELHRLLLSNLKENDVSALAVTDASDQILASAGTPEFLAYIPLTRDMAPNGVQTYQGQLLLKQAVSLSDSGQEDLFSPPGQGEAISRRPNTLGYVVLVLSHRQTEARAGMLISTVLSILIVGLFLTALVSVWLSKRITQPLIQLAKAAAATSRGDLSARVPADAQGELLLLERNFNQMADAIQHSQHELESRIAEATAQYLKQKESAEAANLAKSRFLAAASHDLRQPLHAIGLFVGALANKIRYPEVRDLVDKTTESVTTLENLLNALLDISRLDAAVITPQFASFPIEVIMRQIECEFTPVAAAKNLRFRVRHSHYLVYSDPMLLKRIIGNLVTNAIRYTPEGGVLVACRKRGGMLRVEVRDTGPGIPSEHHAHIFEEFYQIGNVQRDRNKGLGLGLAIVDRMAKLLGIEVGFRTRNMRGSCFYVLLPLAESHHPAQDPLPALEQTGLLEDKLIVVVDDERNVLDGMVALIEGMGSRVIAATTLEEVASQLRKTGMRPDVLISDYRLAETRTGIEVIQSLREEFGSSIPAILVSGDTSPETLKKAEFARLEILHKPVGTAKLTQMLERMTRTVLSA